MTNQRKWFLLVALILLGLFSAGRLSFLQFLSGDACPLLGSVPACYVALSGYIFIALGTVLLWRKSPRKRLTFGSFYLGFAIAGGLALIASVMELFIGGVCPVAFGWLPMCYPSLALSLAIFWLFRGVAKHEEAH